MLTGDLSSCTNSWFPPPILQQWPQPSFTLRPAVTTHTKSYPMSPLSDIPRKHHQILAFCIHWLILTKQTWIILIWHWPTCDKYIQTVWHEWMHVCSCVGQKSNDGLVYLNDNCVAMQWRYNYALFKMAASNVQCMLESIWSPKTARHYKL